MCFPKPRAAEQVQAGTLPRGEMRRIIFAVFQYLGHMLPGREAKLRHQCIRIFFQRERLEGAQRERGGGVHLLLAQLPHQRVHAFAHLAAVAPGVLTDGTGIRGDKARGNIRVSGQQRVPLPVELCGAGQRRVHGRPLRAHGCQTRGLDAGCGASVFQRGQTGHCLRGLSGRGAGSCNSTLPAARYDALRPAVKLIPVHCVFPSCGMPGTRGARRSPPPRILCFTAGAAACTLLEPMALSAITSRTVL